MEKSKLNFSIINIDKPAGPTSFKVSEYVKKSLNLKKTSHFGTLDPKVTGVLPVALERACKLTGYFLGHDKTYIGIMHTHKKQDIKQLQEIINKNFTGKIQQLPPIKSRVKRAIREREIKHFKLLEQSEGKKDFLFETKVQGGTYIRKLIHDLGEKIGGAHMLELRRTKASIFDQSKIYTLYEFKQAVEEYKQGKPEKLEKMLIPAEDAIKQILPTIQVKKSAVKQLLTGKPIFKKDIIGKIPTKEIFAVFQGNQFIEIARKTKENLIFARPEFVFN